MKRKKTPLNRKRILTDPAFESTRQNNAEFACACTANRLLLKAFVLGLRNKGQQYVSGRLTKTMFNILKSDRVNGRGERRVRQGMISILKGFNFNRETSLQNALKAPFSIIFNQEDMLATISFPFFISQAMIETASGANAFMFTAMAGSIHFEEETSPVEPVKTGILDISLQPHENLALQLPVVGHQPDHKVIVTLGIEFFHKIQGTIQPVDKKYNPLAVVEVF